MRYLAQTLCLRDDPERIERYQEYHRRVWPEVISGIRESGIREMRIFLRGNRMFMYVEAEDSFVPERDLAKSQASPRVQEWEALMRTLQQPAPEAGPGEWWAAMEEVFDLNWPQHLPGGIR